MCVCTHTYSIIPAIYASTTSSNRASHTLDSQKTTFISSTAHLSIYVMCCATPLHSVSHILPPLHQSNLAQSPPTNYRLIIHTSYHMHYHQSLLGQHTAEPHTVILGHNHRHPYSSCYKNPTMQPPHNLDRLPHRRYFLGSALHTCYYHQPCQTPPLLLIISRELKEKIINIFGANVLYRVNIGNIIIIFLYYMLIKRKYKITNIFIDEIKMCFSSIKGKTFK